MAVSFVTFHFVVIYGAGRIILMRFSSWRGLAGQSLVGRDLYGQRPIRVGCYLAFLLIISIIIVTCLNRLVVVIQQI